MVFIKLSKVRLITDPGPGTRRTIHSPLPSVYLSSVPRILNCSNVGKVNRLILTFSRVNIIMYPTHKCIKIK